MQINICYDGAQDKLVNDMRFFIEYYFNSMFGKVASMSGGNTVSSDDIMSLFQKASSTGTDTTTGTATIGSGSDTLSGDSLTEGAVPISDEDINDLF